MTPLVVTSSLAGLTCPGMPDGNWGAAGTAAGRVPAGNVTGPGVATGTTATEVAVETLGTGAIPAGAAETGDTAAGASAGVTAIGASAAGASVTGVAAAEGSWAGAIIEVVATVALEFVSGGSWPVEWFNSLIFCSKAVRAAAWAEASADGIFGVKYGSADAVGAGAALSAATGAWTLAAEATVAETVLVTLVVDSADGATAAMEFVSGVGWVAG